eukprot:NODE_9273_length_607_cov_29.425620_g8641_i0.p1 GENE.NODE_9273_length_607_cov_29.425620_g8641_i0~~NODE_9273_length_607_cov_29.425620_g8641_i0.p1  ORF type:complete len:147 (-),score=17.14 NODE_9273_length_607_cov_29.425620_g8641_i0:115-555(-)
MSEEEPKECSRCGEVIRGRHVDAIGVRWHPWCLLCDDCGKPIFEDSFRSDGEVAAHASCLTAFRPRPCAKCGEDVEGWIVCAMDVIWHPHCFTCTICEKPIEKKHKVYDGNPVHRSCKPKHKGMRKKKKNSANVGKASSAKKPAKK